MGTNSVKKFIRYISGRLTEEFALTTSAGAGDADRIPALNASGVLDASIINSKTSSAGAGDAGKIPALNASGVLADSILNASVASSPDKIVKSDGTGRIDLTMMPVGIVPDVALIVASEALAAGDLVNIWNNSSVANARKADGSSSGKEAHGFVLASVSSAATATVYFEGQNTQCTGLTPGLQYLSTTVPGKCTVTVPSGTGKVAQVVGFAVSATSLNFQSGATTDLA